MKLIRRIIRLILVAENWLRMKRIICFLPLCFVFTVAPSGVGRNQNTPEDFKEALIPLSQLTQMDVFSELVKEGVLHPDIVLAQQQIESGHLSSNLVQRTNNMFGMRYPGGRQTAACGIYLPDFGQIISGTREELKYYSSQNNYAVFATWKDAIRDYKLWQDANYPVKMDYYQFLRQVYAEDTTYIDAIQSQVWKNQHGMFAFLESGAE